MKKRQRILLLLIVVVIGSSILGYALGSPFDGDDGKIVCVSSAYIAHDEYGNVTNESAPITCRRE